MTEIWMDIRGFEGMYQISNLGRVKSLARRINKSNGSYWIRERIRKLGVTRGGYLFAPLSKDGRQIGKRVNRLVAEAFLEDYSQSAEIHHKDGDRTNNRADNLECLSAEDHRKRHPPTPIIGEKDGVRLYFDSSEETRKAGFDPPNVSRCCKCSLLPDGHPRKKRYATHKGYRWMYA